MLFNEYHVIDLAPISGLTYPTECPSRPMTPQEEMLEYALFDLSAFVQPIIIPTLSHQVRPQSAHRQAERPASARVKIPVTNTSNNTAIDPSAVLKIALPSRLTATALTDPTGAWICNLSPLQCTHHSSIPSSTTDSVTLTVSVGDYGSGAPQSADIVVTVSSPAFSNDVLAKDPVIFQQSPSIQWPTPAPIVYGTPLSSKQLNTVATVEGKSPTILRPASCSCPDSTSSPQRFTPTTARTTPTGSRP